MGVTEGLTTQHSKELGTKHHSPRVFTPSPLPRIFPRKKGSFFPSVIGYCHLLRSSFLVSSPSSYLQNLCLVFPPHFFHNDSLQKPNSSPFLPHRNLALSLSNTYGLYLSQPRSFSKVFSSTIMLSILKSILQLPYSRNGCNQVF